MRQYKNTKTPPEWRDEMQTPKWLFRWLESEFGVFDLDAASSDSNSLTPNHFTRGNNGLDWNWSFGHKLVFVNPPYSGIDVWFYKAVKEKEYGVTSVFVVPSPNGDFRDSIIAEHSSLIIHIIGRVSFVRPDGIVQKGNNRGTCIVVFEPGKSGPPEARWVFRNQLEQKFGGDEDRS